MASRTFSNQGRKILMNWQLPARKRQDKSVLARNLNRGVQKEWFPLGALSGTPLPIDAALEENQRIRHHLPTHTSFHLFSHTT